MKNFDFETQKMVVRMSNALETITEQFNHEDSKAFKKTLIALEKIAKKSKYNFND